jgi:ABC-2 type transport system permease protein
MRLNFYPVYRREIKAYFQSPSLYIVAGLFFALAGLFFHDILIFFGNLSMDRNLQNIYGQMELNVTQFVVRNTFSLLTFLLIFVIPILTMRLVAEEKKSGTFELLVTCPLRDIDVLLGKYLSCLTILLVFLVISLAYPIVTIILGRPEQLVIATCYLGFFLLAMAYVAYGLFASSATENQIVAAIICFAGLLVFYLIGDLSAAELGRLGSILNALSVREHSVNFTQGVIDPKDVLFFVCFTFFFLFLTSRVLEARRWRV